MQGERGPLKVLLVANEPYLKEIWKETLEQHGEHQVVMASDRESAFMEIEKVAKTEAFDLVLVEISTIDPGMVTVIKQADATFRGKSLLGAIISVTDMWGEVKKLAESAGAKIIIQKSDFARKMYEDGFLFEPQLCRCTTIK